MSEPPTLTHTTRARLAPPPMTEAEYRTVRASFMLRTAFALAVAVGGAWVGLNQILPLGPAPSAFLGLAVGFGLGAKCFPSSGLVSGIRYRNYRRAKRGLPPLDPDQVPELSAFDEFRKG